MCCYNFSDQYSSNLHSYTENYERPPTIEFVTKIFEREYLKTLEVTKYESNQEEEINK